MQNTFKRFELKYILSHTQYTHLCTCMKEHMHLDSYGKHKISNIYFDTNDYKIIRHSLEKPRYKEKLRLRVYGEPQENGLAFIELKKKFDGVVYKRRIPYSQGNALSYLCDEQAHEELCQIGKEVKYFQQIYKGLIPKVYLSYEREAYFCPNDEHFRMTFDFNIKMRDSHLSLFDHDIDKKIVDDNTILLEVKTVEGLPFWFLDFLNQNRLYKTSFSKYGTAYNLFILPKFVKELKERKYA